VEYPQKWTKESNMETPGTPGPEVDPGEDEDPEPEEGDFFEELPLDDPAEKEGDDNDVPDALKEKK
jgi:hypothetical protein